MSFDQIIHIDGERKAVLIKALQAYRGPRVTAVMQHDGDDPNPDILRWGHEAVVAGAILEELE